MTQTAHQDPEDFDLERCPFCGSDDIDVDFARGYESGDRKKPIIGSGCNACGATGPMVIVPTNSTGYSESAEKWNSRSSSNMTAEVPQR